MLQLDTDENFENYPYYIGWVVNRSLPLHQPHESDEEQTPEPLDKLADELKLETPPPVLNSEGDSVY